MDIIGTIRAEGVGIDLPLLELDTQIGMAKAKDPDGINRFINLRNTKTRIDLYDK